MTGELQIFSNPEFGQIRTLLIDNEPWAVGKDVATALGYKNASKAVITHVDDEDKRFEMMPVADSQNGNVANQNGNAVKTTIINESGLYSLILSSKLPNAKHFKRWVTSEILPTLRRTGSYTMPGVKAAQETVIRESYLTAARILAGCRNDRLPFVIPLIQKAGIDVTVDLKLTGMSGNAKDPTTARLLNTAFNDYDVSIRQLERLTGIHSAQIYRMRNGTSRYNAARAAIIRDALRALVPELDIDSIAQDA